jgi:ABC-type phosphate transport system substrate-binding protein
MNDFNDLVEAGTLRPPFLISLRVACPTLTTTIGGTGRLETPLYNGPGNDSWPIPFITFLALKQNITAADCTPIKELLNFIAWTQINDQAISAVSGMGYMPLAFAYRSKLIDLLGRITCNGDQALPTAYLLGLGSGLPVYTDWSLTYSNTQTNLKIYTDLTRKAPLEQITSGQSPDLAADAGALCVHRSHFGHNCCTASAGVVDFEMSTEKPTDSQMAASSDLLSIPLVATAIVPAYYVRPPQYSTLRTAFLFFELGP